METCDGCYQKFPKGTLRRDSKDSSLLYCDDCPSEELKLWILVWHHRHGHDVRLVLARTGGRARDIFEDHEPEFEPERDEYVDYYEIGVDALLPPGVHVAYGVGARAGMGG